MLPMSFDPKRMLREQHEQRLSQSWLLRKLYEFNQAHNRLKDRVHAAWRYPLPPWGRVVMGFVYFSIPVGLGYNVSMWAVSQSETTMEERFGDKGRDTGFRENVFSSPSNILNVIVFLK